MSMKKSVLREVIEDIWNTYSLNEGKIKLRDLMSNVKMRSEEKKLILLNDIGNCSSKDDLDYLAANCMLKFEGHGLI